MEAPAYRIDRLPEVKVIPTVHRGVLRASPDRTLCVEACGNLGLLDAPRGCVASRGPKCIWLQSEIDAYEEEALKVVLAGRVLVCGTHNRAHQRAAAMALKFCSPRILVVHGTLVQQLGPALQNEPSGESRCWRPLLDTKSDLVIAVEGDQHNVELSIQSITSGMPLIWQSSARISA